MSKIRVQQNVPGVLVTYLKPYNKFEIPIIVTIQIVVLLSNANVSKELSFFTFMVGAPEYVPPKRLFLYPRFHGVTTQKTTIWT